MNDIMRTQGDIIFILIYALYEEYTVTVNHADKVHADEPISKSIVYN